MKKLIPFTLLFALVLLGVALLYSQGGSLTPVYIIASGPTGPCNASYGAMNLTARTISTCPASSWVGADMSGPTGPTGPTGGAPANLSADFTWNPGVMALGSSPTTTVTVTGAVVNAKCKVAVKTAFVSGVTFDCSVFATNVATIQAVSTIVATPGLLSLRAYVNQ